MFEKGPVLPLPSWDQQLPASTRFVVLTNWGSQAVLDRETGLVWERAPVFDLETWPTAARFCRLTSTGGRFGWRLPSEEELATLVDQTSGDGPPAGHPFQGFIVGQGFWTASTNENAPTSSVYVINFGGIPLVTVSGVGSNHLYWCVRGGSGAQNPIQGLP